MTLAIHVDGLFDGKAFHGPSIIDIAGGRTIAVRPIGQPDISASDVIHFGPGSFALPGMIDVHTHLGFNGGADPVGELIRSDDSALLAQMRTAGRTALEAGITTVRDLGDRGYLSLEVAREFLKAPDSGPDILAAGPPITTRDGHCHFLGGVADGPDELRAAVRERYERGCSAVKIMVSGGHITPGSSPFVRQYSRADIRIVVDEAHRLGLPVAAHAHSSPAIADAVHAGVDSLEHATFMTPDGPVAPEWLIPEIAASRVFVDPTAGMTPTGNSDLAAVITANFDKLVAPYRLMRDLGVRFINGSDAGVGPGKPHDVLSYAVEHSLRFGLTPADALATVTSLAASACGIDDHKGFVRPGMDADLLVVDGNPAADMSALRAVRAVFRSGEQITRSQQSAPVA
ncbi:amidohydrolase family protein [Catenuloplanes sp. NPDC051500]|uniref:amidohydrolase family protein n=1 Tax=Catenuloplanes sp. NPDC051500 TaxID=3363959 RepID=UPI0037A5EF78